MRCSVHSLAKWDMKPQPAPIPWASGRGSAQLAPSPQWRLILWACPPPPPLLSASAPGPPFCSPNSPSLSQREPWPGWRARLPGCHVVQLRLQMWRGGGTPCAPAHLPPPCACGPLTLKTVSATCRASCQDPCHGLSEPCPQPPRSAYQPPLPRPLLPQPALWMEPLLPRSPPGVPRLPESSAVCARPGPCGKPWGPLLRSPQAEPGDLVLLPGDYATLELSLPLPVPHFPQLHNEL